MSRAVLIETSSRSSLVAIAEEGVVRVSRRLDEARRNARDLVPALAELLSLHGWAPASLALVAAGVGPGSYTGLRVGLMAAKALAYALRCRLVGVETFAALARQAPGGLVDVIADAQKGAVYVQEFDGPSPVGPVQVRLAEEWAASRRPTAWATGPGMVKHGYLVEPSRAAPPDSWHPSAEALLAVALESPDSDPMTLAPLYVQASSAERQWDALGR
jgi:tRNA threonylcarbamoyladenosine biosynthesis protein TsaB